MKVIAHFIITARIDDMFEVVLTQVSIMTWSIAVLKETDCDLNLIWKSDGVHVQFADANFAWVKTLFISAKEFERYHCDTEVHLGINACSLHSSLKCEKDETALTIAVDSEESPTELSIEAKEEHRRHAFRVVELVDQQYEEPNDRQPIFEAKLRRNALFRTLATTPNGSTVKFALKNNVFYCISSGINGETVKSFTDEEFEQPLNRREMNDVDLGEYDKKRLAKSCKGPVVKRNRKSRSNENDVADSRCVVQFYRSHVSLIHQFSRGSVYRLDIERLENNE